MARTKFLSEKGDALRRRAEKLLAKKRKSAPEKLPQDLQKLIHELRVHQVELEMQNGELRRTQLELMDSRNKYADLYDFAPIGYFTFDQKGRIVEVNLTGARQLGIERGSLINRPFFLFVLPEFRNLFHSFQHRVSETGTQQSCELKVMKKDGSSFYASILGVMVQDPSKKMIDCRCAIMDITERKRAEEVFREAKQEAERRAEAEKGKRILDALMAHVPTGITIADAKDLRVEAASQYGQVLTRFENNRMVNVPLNGHAPSWLHPESGAPALPEEMPLLRAIRRGEIVIDEEWILQRSSGERFTILCNAAPIRDPHGNINAGVLAWTDITTQKMAQERIEMQAEELRRNRDELTDRTVQLERLNRELVSLNAELDSFTHMASHDLQEPLRTLIAFSDLLYKDLGQSLPEQAARDLGFINDASKRMQILIRDLLALSRAGRAAKKREKVSLRDCADQALEALAMRVTETGAQIAYDLLPDVWGDAGLLTELYQNLIGNALKFSGDQRPIIQLTFEEKDGDQIYGVKDNGIGIEPKYAQEIFQPFRRLHGRAEYEGSGIGLAICRKVVERHGGKIWVESKPGKGAHFRFTILHRRGERRERRIEAPSHSSS